MVLSESGASRSNDSNEITNATKRAGHPAESNSTELLVRRALLFERPCSRTGERQSCGLRHRSTGWTAGGAISLRFSAHAALRVANAGRSRRASAGARRGCIPVGLRSPVPRDIGLFGPEYFDRVRSEITSAMEAAREDVEQDVCTEARIRRWRSCTCCIRGGVLRASGTGL